jgi:hypothetical protein
LLIGLSRTLSSSSQSLKADNKLHKLWSKRRFEWPISKPQSFDKVGLDEVGLKRALGRDERRVLVVHLWQGVRERRTANLSARQQGLSATNLRPSISKP